MEESKKPKPEQDTVTYLRQLRVYSMSLEKRNQTIDSLKARQRLDGEEDDVEDKSILYPTYLKKLETKRLL